MMNKQEQIKYSVEQFQQQCCPFGYTDLQQAIEWINESTLAEDHKESEMLWKLISEFNTNIGYDENNLSFDGHTHDVCYLVLDRILQESRQVIENLTDKDIQNDFSIETHGNYCCSSYDINQNYDETIEFLNTIETDNKLVKWFIDMCQ